MDDVRLEEKKATVATDEAVVFSMRNQPLLEQGTTYDSLATAENLWAAIKVYASGGENALHSHAGEDHIFVIMQGKATFTFGDGRTRIVRQHEGVMIPKNVTYKFEADETENLVMLRVGGRPSVSRHRVPFVSGPVKATAYARGRTSTPNVSLGPSMALVQLWPASRLA